MTRPPFAEFSALAIRELTAWIGGNALWAERLKDVLSEHFLPVAEKLGLQPGEAWEALGESRGPVYGAALEDLCTRRYDDPPQNLVVDFLKKRGFRLPPLAKAYLEAMRDSAPGVYEVVAVEPGHGVTVRDLLIGGEAIDVIEVSGSRQMVPWDRIAARVVEHGGKRVFTGALMPLSAADGKAAIDELAALLHGAAGEASVAADIFRSVVAGVMRDAAPLLAGLQIARVLGAKHRPLPTLINRDGDSIAFATARYSITSGSRKHVVARLDAEPGLTRTGSRPASWHWSGPILERPAGVDMNGKILALDSHPDSDATHVVLASLTLSGIQLEISVNSQRRLERARGFLEPLLAGLLGEPDLALKSVEEARAENQEQGASRRRSVPKRLEREVTQRYLDGHYRNWLDKKIPALDGKSPREAARDFGGREQLIALLKELENREARRAKDTGIGYDARWLWRELGIENLRR
jgi:hypothetical protein